MQDAPSINVSPIFPNGPPHANEPVSMDMLPNSGISPIFVVLVTLVREKAGNEGQVMCSEIRDVLVQQNPSVYQRAGVKKFKQYINLAISAGVLIAGGKGAHRWISLLPANRSEDVASASIGSNSVPSSLDSSTFPSSAPISSSQNVTIVPSDQSEAPIEALVESSQTHSPESALERLRRWPTALLEKSPLGSRHSIPLPSKFSILVRMIMEHHGDKVHVLYKTHFVCEMLLLIKGPV